MALKRNPPPNSPLPAVRSEIHLHPRPIRSTIAYGGTILQPATGQKDTVLSAIQNAVTAFSDNNPTVQEKMSEAFPDAASRDQARGQIISNLEVAYHQASNSETDPRWFNPRGPMAGLAQSAMNQHAQSAITAAGQVGAAITSDAAVATAGGVLPAAAAGASAATAAASTHEPFGAHDPGWIECIIDGFATALRGKARFIQHQSLSDFLYPIPDQVTIALVSDWGANNHAAALISDQIRAVRPDIVIHLGDIYYAGQRNEALAMLKLWPLGDKATGAIEHGKSFALNGNHEMFSGGHAYFETVLKAFGQPASYFGFRNSKWQILAFDSAYIEHRLLTPQDFPHDRRLKSQWDWLVDKMKNSKLPTILLSHHQPVSAFLKENTESAKLRTDYHQFATESGRHVFGWFFGHEHRCTIYDDVNIPYFARLIGNGCIPHTPPTVNQKPDQGCYSFSKTNTSANAKGSAMSGFALLKFAAADIDITYINEDGNHFHQESWHSPQ